MTKRYSQIRSWSGAYIAGHLVGHFSRAILYDTLCCAASGKGTLRFAFLQRFVAYVVHKICFDVILVILCVILLQFIRKTYNVVCQCT